MKYLSTEGNKAITASGQLTQISVGQTRSHGVQTPVLHYKQNICL